MIHVSSIRIRFFSYWYENRSNYSNFLKSQWFCWNIIHLNFFETNIQFVKCQNCLQLMFLTIIVFWNRFVVWSFCQRIRFRVYFFCLIKDYEIEINEKFCSFNLSSIQFFDDHEIFQKFVIDQDFDWFTDWLQFRFSFFETANNC